MCYLFCLIFIIISYILPFIICNNLLIWLDKNEPASLGGALFIFLAYIILYVLRFFAFVIVALISFCFKDRFVILYKYNFLILLLLFMIDIFLYNTLDLFFNADFFKREGFIRFAGFLSLASTYFPFWLVFGIRNLISNIKTLKHQDIE